VNAPDALPAFHVMAKPTGARCNLRCDYCFFLEKERFYPGSGFRMSDETMEAYIRQTLTAHRVPEVTIAWQGGEPTLMGLEFFRRAVAVEQAAAPPGVRIENTLQTNGVLLDDAWCAFLAENRFLVGLSLDGPRRLHDAYRHDRAGNPVFDRVLAAARRLQKYGVEFNVLCTVNAVNSRHPLEVYRFFRDELGARYLQFIPIVELEEGAGERREGRVTERSVRPAQYGRFLIEIFDEWVRRDVGNMFVQFFDGVLASWLRGRSTLCVLSPTCGEGVALEHNGDVYSCDHFVDPSHLLGNIHRTPIGELVASEQQRAFGRAKSETLPRACRACRFLFTCHGECPKNRVLTTADGEPGLNWLCDGLNAFFAHTERPMKPMAELLRRGQTADRIMGLPAEGGERPAGAFARVGRNEPCPCGSGAKFKKCHGGNVP
jgi:uncharacterized protein